MPRSMMAVTKRERRITRSPFNRSTERTRTTTTSPSTVWGLRAHGNAFVRELGPGSGAAAFAVRDVRDPVDLRPRPRPGRAHHRWRQHHRTPVVRGGARRLGRHAGGPRIGMSLIDRTLPLERRDAEPTSRRTRWTTSADTVRPFLNGPGFESREPIRVDANRDDGTHGHGVFWNTTRSLQRFLA